MLATDVQPEMIQMLQRERPTAGVTNIKPLLCSQGDTKLPDGEGRPGPDGRRLPRVFRPRGNLAGLCKALRPGGRLVLVEFRGEDPEVPIKPEHKMTLEQVRREVEPQGFTFKNSLEFLPWQHVIIFEKPDVARDGKTERRPRTPPARSCQKRSPRAFRGTGHSV